MKITACETFLKCKLSHIVKFWFVNISLLTKGGQKIHYTKSDLDGVSQKYRKDMRSIHHIGLCITGWGGGGLVFKTNHRKTSD